MRAHSEDERTYLEQHGADCVRVGEQELALSLAHAALMTLGHDDSADGVIEQSRNAEERTTAHR